MVLGGVSDREEKEEGVRVHVVLVLKEQSEVGYRGLRASSYRIFFWFLFSFDWLRKRRDWFSHL